MRWRWCGQSNFDREAGWFLLFTDVTEMKNTRATCASPNRRLAASEASGVFCDIATVRTR